MEGAGAGGSKGNLLERKARPAKEEALKCPRCNSSNTKFCYYNNYSLSQPRYFCKACRRYWTDGGSLRNVPVGGGSRKNKIRSDHKIKINGSDQNPKIHHTQDLNLAILPSSTSSSSSSHSLLLGSFMAAPSAGLGFSLEGFENSGYGNLLHHHHHQHQHQHQDQTAAMFPIEDLKQPNGAAAAAGAGFEHGGGESGGGFWNGMLGGGSW